MAQSKKTSPGVPIEALLQEKRILGEPCARARLLRRLLRDIAEGRVLGDTTTLADPAVVAALKKQYEEE